MSLTRNCLRLDNREFANVTSSGSVADWEEAGEAAAVVITNSSTGHEDLMMTGECHPVMYDRFPPYVEQEGGGLFSDPTASEIVVCGATAEAIKILLQRITTTGDRDHCLRRAIADTATPQEVLWARQDFKLGIEYVLFSESYHLYDVGYPLGSIQEMSVLGRENTITPGHIRILNILPFDIWIALIATLVVTVWVVAAARQRLAAVLSQSEHRLRTLAYNWSASLVDFLGILTGCATPRSHGTRGLKQAIQCLVFIWSLVSGLVLTRIASSDILELIMFKNQTDRYRSFADFRRRAPHNTSVAVFPNSFVDRMIKDGVFPLAEDQQIQIRGDDETVAEMLALIEPINRQEVVAIGIPVVLQYLRMNAANMIDCEVCRTVFYVQEDRNYAETPYYVPTSGRWPPEWTRRWRDTTARLLENGLSQYAYDRAVAETIPVIAHAAADERESRRRLNVEILRVRSLWVMFAFLAILSAVSLLAAILELFF